MAELCGFVFSIVCNTVTISFSSVLSKQEFLQIAIVQLISPKGSTLQKSLLNFTQLFIDYCSSMFILIVSSKFLAAFSS